MQGKEITSFNHVRDHNVASCDLLAFLEEVWDMWDPK